MMYRTELVEGITVENVIEKINAKIEAVLPLLFNLRNTGWKQAAPIIEGIMMHIE